MFWARWVFSPVLFMSLHNMLTYSSWGMEGLKTTTIVQWFAWTGEMWVILVCDAPCLRTKSLWTIIWQTVSVHEICDAVERPPNVLEISNSQGILSWICSTCPSSLVMTGFIGTFYCALKIVPSGKYFLGNDRHSFRKFRCMQNRSYASWRHQNCKVPPLNILLHALQLMLLWKFGKHFDLMETMYLEMLRNCHKL